MIINFSFKNFRSFRDVANLSLEAIDIRGTEKIAIVKAISGRNILPVAGIFGANAGGKTNVIKALDYVLQAVTGEDRRGNLIKDITRHPLFARFCLDGNKSPAEFELEVLSSNYMREYTISFAVDDKEVIYEKLSFYERSEKNRVAHEVYSKENGSIKFGKEFKQELEKFKDTCLRRNNNLLVNWLPDLTNNVRPVIDFLSEIKHIHLQGWGLHTSVKELYENEGLLKEVVRIVNESDTSVLDIKPLKMPDEVRDAMLNNPSVPENIKRDIRKGEFYSISSGHKSYDDRGGLVSLDFGADESNGTNKLFSIASMIVKAIREGGTLVLDELDSSLHPYITAKIVETFQDKGINTNGAQLVFSSHEYYLMSKAVSLRTDEIYFVEKDKQEQSELYSLADFNLKNDAAIDRRYLDGRLGAVPIIASGGFDVHGQEI